jgi:hypothetical protein
MRPRSSESPPVRYCSKLDAMKYVPNLRHRDGTPGKSQWIISELQELASFEGAITNGWCMTHVGWGLHSPNGTPEYLGVAIDRCTRLFLAKFVGGDLIWHGYPADPQRNYQDIPHPILLREWLNDGLLTPARIRKISRGQPCAL